MAYFSFSHFYKIKNMRLPSESSSSRHLANILSTHCRCKSDKALSNVTRNGPYLYVFDQCSSKLYCFQKPYATSSDCLAVTSHSDIIENEISPQITAEKILVDPVDPTLILLLTAETGQAHVCRVYLGGSVYNVVQPYLVDEHIADRVAPSAKVRVLHGDWLPLSTNQNRSSIVLLWSDGYLRFYYVDNLRYPYKSIPLLHEEKQSSMKFRAAELCDRDPVSFDLLQHEEEPHAVVLYSDGSVSCVSLSCHADTESGPFDLALFPARDDNFFQLEEAQEIACFPCENGLHVVSIALPGMVWNFVLLVGQQSSSASDDLEKRTSIPFSGLLLVEQVKFEEHSKSLRLDRHVACKQLHSGCGVPHYTVATDSEVYLVRLDFMSELSSFQLEEAEHPVLRSCVVPCLPSDLEENEFGHLLGSVCHCAYQERPTEKTQLVIYRTSSDETRIYCNDLAHCGKKTVLYLKGTSNENATVLQSNAAQINTTLSSARNATTADAALKQLQKCTNMMKEQSLLIARQIEDVKVQDTLSNSLKSRHVQLDKSSQQLSAQSANSKLTNEKLCQLEYRVEHLLQDLRADCGMSSASNSILAEMRGLAAETEQLYNREMVELTDRYENLALTKRQPCKTATEDPATVLNLLEAQDDSLALLCSKVENLMAESAAVE